MEKIVPMRTKEQRDFDRLSNHIEKEIAEYEAFLEHLDRKEEWGEEPTEKDIDDILLWMQHISRENRELHEKLRKINPEGTAEVERIKREAIREALADMHAEEHGLKIVR